MSNRPFDIAEMLDTPEVIAAYLAEAMADDDPKMFLMALGDVARAKGMNDMAKATGLGRQSLYKAFNGNVEPKFSTVRKVVKALDLDLAITA